jgi:CheY-like chemotaxis protein
MSTAQTSPAGASGTTMSVLVVDDNADMRDSLGRLLASRGYRVRTAGDGVEALQAVDEDVPDCVLLDLTMPRMDGVEFAHKVRDAHARNVVIIAVSGRTDLHLTSDELDAMDHWLTKPINMKTFYDLFPDVRPTGTVGRGGPGSAAAP